MDRNIYITTNVQCNLRCVYCYEDKKGDDIFDMEKAKSRLIEDLSEPKDDTVYINLHGGEPFLVFDQIKELCEWAWEQNFPQNFVFFATTNGTLVHGRIKEWLYDNRHRFVAGLSLDGTREMHNANRSNSFDLIDLDFFSSTWPTQSVKMTVSPLSLPMLADGVKFVKSKGFERLDVNLAYMIDWDKPEYIRIYYRELMKLLEYYKEHPDYIKNCSIFDKRFVVLNYEDSETRKWCGAGTEMEVYDVDGKKYPCHLFFPNVCGKEKSENWHNINFNDPNEYIKGECGKCPIYAICPTCYAANYIERDDIGLRDMSLCRLEKVRTLVVAKYQYDRIVNSNEDVNSFSAEEMCERMDILKGLEKIAPALEEYQRMVDELL